MPRPLLLTPAPGPRPRRKLPRTPAPAARRAVSRAAAVRPGPAGSCREPVRLSRGCRRLRPRPLPVRPPGCPPPAGSDPCERFRARRLAGPGSRRAVRRSADPLGAPAWGFRDRPRVSRDSASGAPDPVRCRPGRGSGPRCYHPARRPRRGRASVSEVEFTGDRPARGAAPAFVGTDTRCPPATASGRSRRP